MLGAPGLFRVFLLQRPVAELAVVADSFHTKPLRQWLQSTGRIDAADLDNPRADDVLDDLGALVERMGGEVHVLPAERMPCRTP